MISKGSNKTAAEKAWHRTVSEFANNSTWLNDMYGGHVRDPHQWQLDHIVGAMAKRKINGVSVKIGEFAVMPISLEIHDLTSNHPLNRTLRPAAYRKAFGHEKQVWLSMLNAMKRAGIELPFGDDLIYSVVER